MEKLSEPVKKTILISGCINNLGNKDFDDLNKSFYSKNFDWSTIKKNSQSIEIFHGDNDPYIPITEAQKLSNKLGCNLKIINQGGHLNESAGFTEFPELLTEIN